MTFLIREATLADLPVLREFEQGIIAYERPFDPKIKPDPVSYYDLAGHIEREDAYVAVAELNNELIGSGFARKQRSRHYTSPEYHAYIGFLYTRPQHRGKGVNQKILDALLDWAAVNNLTDVRLTVYPGNASAIRAYEKAGFQPDILEMHLKLGN